MLRTLLRHPSLPRSLPWALFSFLALAAPLAASGSEPVHGLDVSHHSGEVDWETVAAQGYDFVFLKASEGVDDPDPKFAQHWQALPGHGLVRGAYHFYVTEDDPRAQAELFLSTVDYRPGDLAPAVDVELVGHQTPEDWTDGLLRFLQIVEGEVGVPPILYTSPRFAAEHFTGPGADRRFGRYPLWIAEYEVEEPAVPGAWSEWVLWQFEGDSDVPGVEKGADVSKAASREHLDRLRLPLATFSADPDP